MAQDFRQVLVALDKLCMTEFWPKLYLLPEGLGRVAGALTALGERRHKKPKHYDRAKLHEYLMLPLRARNNECVMLKERRRKEKSGLNKASLIHDK